MAPSPTSSTSLESDSGTTSEIALRPSFGLGAHFCLGAPLARLEGQLAINTLLGRLPGLRLAVAPGHVRWRRGLLLRGLEALPVAWGAPAYGVPADPSWNSRGASSLR